MSFTLDLSWVLPVLLAAVRFTVFVVLAPPFSTTAFPGPVKAMLGIGLAVAVAPRLNADAVNSLSLGEVIVAFVANLVTGLAFGILVKMIFSAVQAAGSLVDQFGGFSMNSAYDPLQQLQGGEFTRLFELIAGVLMFTTGAYRILLAGLARTFDAIPITAHVDLAKLGEQFSEGITNTLLAAVQIAGPLVIVLFLADIALGLLTRVAPQTNVFSLGFPVKILISLAFVGLVVAVLPSAMDSLTAQAETALGVN